MPKFSTPEKQAASVMKGLQGKHIQSVGTVRNYENALKQVANHLVENKQGSLRSLTPETAVQYLEQRGQEVSQKTLDMERQAIQTMMRHSTNSLAPGTNLTRVQSELTQALNSRFYESKQAAAVANAQTQANQLATQISLAAGLRAHELLTLRPANERAMDNRPAHEGKFSGRSGALYTVQGKGGLVREVMIPKHLAERLESCRLKEPTTITDRGVNYTSHYQIAGGQRWSNSFSAASSRVLGWSRGAHGLRHTYAQQRMSELQKLGYQRSEALLICSQEMGHFRESITEVYLR